ncbi:translation initiation factor IF-3 [bacterium]|nr:translation initiation factor IF-3 [bacterium]
MPIAKKNRIRVNEKIIADKVRLIDADGNQLGIVSVAKALEQAGEAELDLVEISPNAKPPVCKILDYGKFKYEEQKRDQQSKKKQHVVKIKEIRLRPRIDQHDLETKVNMGRKFLKDGCKLKVTLMFRGRELSRLDLGEIVLDKVAEMLTDIAEIEKRDPMEGRRITVMYSAK